MRSLSVGLLALVILGIAGMQSTLADAQIPNPSIPDNGLNTESPIGLPPHASTEGTNEQVNLSNGSLYFYLPLLSFPQRGGWTMPIGLSYSSNYLHPVQLVSVSNSTDNSDGTYIPVDALRYNEIYQNPNSRLIENNLPRISSTVEYMGATPQKTPLGFVEANIPLYCVTNWTFSDWSGSSHAFSNTSSCSRSRYGVTPQVTDALDGSFYRLDTTNPSDLVVYAKNGTQYHFKGYIDPFANLPNNSCSCLTSPQQDESYFATTSMQMIDTNGNTVSVADTVAPDKESYTTTVTDTVGRQILITSYVASMAETIQYPDANSKSVSDLRSITLSPLTAGPVSSQTLTYPNLGCYWNGASVSSPFIMPTVNSTVKAAHNNTYTASVTLPVSDASGHQRHYTFSFDAAQHLLKVTYPTGGYTRYEYQDFIEAVEMGQVACSSSDMFQVAAKHECTAASGQCAQENTTTYSAGPQSLVGLGSTPYNTTMAVTDPVGTQTTHRFAVKAEFSTNPLETDVSIASNRGQLLRSTHTDYTDSNPLTEYNFPTAVTTTLNDSSSQAQSSVTYQYGVPYQLLGRVGQPVSAYLDNVTATNVYDYQSKWLSSTTSSWKPSSAFSVPQILDRMDTGTTTDKISGVSVTSARRYDTVGNLAGITRTGSDGISSSVSYGPYVYGYPSYSIDAGGNKTSLSYANAWSSGGGCNASASPGAYLTKVTQPSGATTSFVYSACSGSIASSTDVNQNTTTYSYDSLGRQTSASMPGGFGQTTIFSDATPNTITATQKATPSPDIVSPTTLDGAGRTVISTLGNAETDTSYDAAGRVTTITNPFPVGGSSSASTTFAYDALSRKTSTTYPDGSATASIFQGELSLVKDEVGAARVITSNAAGQPVQVCEVTPTLASGEAVGACPVVAQNALSGYSTGYQYSGSGQLTKVVARAQTRTFAYDSFGRLNTSLNPESGLTCYGTWSGGSVEVGVCQSGYDAAGNLITKTDARGVKSQFTYDSESRLLSKTYTDGTRSSCYQYDRATAAVPNSVGRLVHEWTQAGSCPASLPSTGVLTRRSVTMYDPMGRVTQAQQCVLANCQAVPFTLAETFDLVGNRLSWTNGLGTNTFNQQFDASGRLLSLSSSSATGATPVSLFQGQVYTPSGALQNWTLGTNLSLQRTYDTRLRVTSETATHH